MTIFVIKIVTPRRPKGVCGNPPKIFLNSFFVQ